MKPKYFFLISIIISLFTSCAETREWEYMQAHGGIWIDSLPYRVKKEWYLPVNCNINDTTTPTLLKPKMGVAWLKSEVLDNTIHIQVVTKPFKKNCDCKGLIIEDLEPKKYIIYYGFPDEMDHIIGDIDLTKKK
jgi:hypothetical protein